MSRRRKQQNKPGEIDLREGGDKAEGWGCWDGERGRGKEEARHHSVFKLAAVFEDTEDFGERHDSYAFRSTVSHMQLYHFLKCYD